MVRISNLDSDGSWNDDIPENEHLNPSGPRSGVREWIPRNVILFKNAWLVEDVSCGDF